jgi:hypothetical protein
MAQSFVPDDFVVPRGLVGPGFRLEPLGPQHNEADHDAWMSSIEHIRATPGFSDGEWPPVGGLSLAENLRDLERHADDRSLSSWMRQLRGEFSVRPPRCRVC